MWEQMVMTMKMDFNELQSPSDFRKVVGTCKRCGLPVLTGQWRRRTKTGRYVWHLKCFLEEREAMERRPKWSIDIDLPFEFFLYNDVEDFTRYVLWKMEKAGIEVDSWQWRPGEMWYGQYNGEWADVDTWFAEERGYAPNAHYASKKRVSIIRFLITYKKKRGKRHE